MDNNFSYKAMREGLTIKYCKEGVFQIFRPNEKEPFAELEIDDAVMFANFVAHIVCSNSTLIVENAIDYSGNKEQWIQAIAERIIKRAEIIK
jgi:hypothetical protein